MRLSASQSCMLSWYGAPSEPQPQRRSIPFASSNDTPHWKRITNHTLGQSRGIVHRRVDTGEVDGRKRWGNRNEQTYGLEHWEWWEKWVRERERERKRERERERGGEREEGGRHLCGKREKQWRGVQKWRLGRWRWEDCTTCRRWASYPALQVTSILHMVPIMRCPSSLYSTK